MERFKTVALIGGGEFGEVEEVVRVDQNGDIVEAGLARKKLAIGYTNDAEAIARFKREVRCLDDLDHPNVIELVGRDLNDNPPWFVMPKADSALDKEIPNHIGDRA